MEREKNGLMEREKNEDRGGMGVKRADVMVEKEICSDSNFSPQASERSPQQRCFVGAQPF